MLLLPYGYKQSRISRSPYPPIGEGARCHRGPKFRPLTTNFGWHAEKFCHWFSRFRHAKRKRLPAPGLESMDLFGLLVASQGIFSAMYSILFHTDCFALNNAIHCNHEFEHAATKSDRRRKYSYCIFIKRNKCLKPNAPKWFFRFI